MPPAHSCCFAENAGTTPGPPNPHLNRKAIIMTKKTVAAIAGSCAHALARKWAQQNGLRSVEAAVLAWAVGAVVSTAILRA